MLSPYAPMIEPFDLKKRTRLTLPSFSISLIPTRSALLVSGFRIAILEISKGISLVIIPPLMPRIGLGFDGVLQH